MYSQALTDNYGGQRIVVTGGTGFIGARLLRRLVQAQPKELRILVRSSSSLELVKDLNLEVKVAPLEDSSALDDALVGADFVFHLAGLTRGKSPEQLHDVNAKGTENLARSVAKVATDCKRFLLVSSQAAFGPNPPNCEAVKEDDQPRPVTWYGESKLEAEASLLAHIGQVPWSIVRPPGVYGPGEKDFLSMFRMVKSRFSPVIGFKPKHYSLVYSEDLVEAILAVGGAEKTIGRSYFAADPAVYSSRDLLAAIEEALGRRAFKPPLPHVLVQTMAALNSAVTPLLARPPLLNLQKVKELTPNRWVVATDRLKEDTGFVCPTSLKEGIQATADWYREKGWL